MRDDEEGVEEERGTIERVEKIDEEEVDVDELEFEAEYTSGEDDGVDGEEEENEELFYMRLYLKVFQRISHLNW